MALNIFTEETQKAILTALREQNALLKVMANGWEITDYNAVLDLVDAGFGPKYFPDGTQLIVPHSEYGDGQIIFTVVGHDNYSNPDFPNGHTATLLMHRVIYGMALDAQELLWANTTGETLPAGTYHLKCEFSAYDGGTNEDGNYQFTITKPIPSGGGIRHTKIGVYSSNGYSRENVLSGTFITYGADYKVIENGIITADGTGGEALGTASTRYANTVNTLGAFNSTHRCAHGSGDWGESNLHTWLNSIAPAGEWFTGKTPFDMPPNYASAAGFLHGIDPGFLSIIGGVDVISARNTIFNADGQLGGMRVTRDKFFLPSMTEFGFGLNNGISEGNKLQYYDGAENVDRIKYDIASENTARGWWSRSPHPSYANSARLVHTTGALADNSASNGRGAAAACVIRKSK